MGYECPVCGTPQADRRHLADHLAMTALTRGGDHESWLDETVPEWTEMGPDDLGPLVAEHAREREFPQVFEDTTGNDHGHGPDPTFEDHLAGAGRRGPGAGRGDRTDETAAVLRDAREMTERMLDARGDEDDGRDGEDEAGTGEPGDGEGRTDDGTGGADE